MANIYETGHAHKVANFAGHLTDAITFTDPKNTTFAGKFAFTMPAPTTSGQFTVSLMATDQAKAMYFCIQIHYAIAMDGGFDAVDHHHIPGAYWCEPRRPVFPAAALTRRSPPLSPWQHERPHQAAAVLLPHSGAHQLQLGQPVLQLLRAGRGHVLHERPLQERALLLPRPVPAHLQDRQ